jgi:hypothetical protein
LTKDLDYIDDEVYQELNAELEKASWYLNAYAKGIINNNGIPKE